jgi:hypothetical protein
MDINQDRYNWSNKLKGFRLIDDTFFNQVFQNHTEAVELLLQIILDQPNLHIIQTQTQYFIKNLFGRSVRLDVYAVDDHGTRYNIEVQRASKEARAQRARYYSSVLDANISYQGMEFQKLSDTYIVFITEQDVLGKGRPVYRIKRMTDSGDDFKDGSHIIYVNAKVRDSSPIGKLMHDFFCTSAKKMNYPLLAELVRYYKETEDGVKVMCAVMEKTCAEVAIRIYRNDCNYSDEQIIQRIMAEFSLSEDEAKNYVSGYRNSQNEKLESNG